MNIEPIKLTVITDMENQTIKMYEDFMGNRIKTLIDLKERSVREALIALGWTPPKKD